MLTCTEYGTWSPSNPPTCLDPKESPEIFKQYQDESKSGSSSPWGIILGLFFGILLILGILGALVWKLKMNKRVPKDISGRNGRHSAGASSKEQPMVLFPNGTNNGPPSGMHAQPSQSHYYDNPTVDPIYENMDDYGVTSSSASVVTINGVSVS